MSHGNPQAYVGTCRVCGQREQALTARFVCVDEFACFAAWCEATS